MNALVDKEVIDALYAASQAGVAIDLIVRGICCLRPGVSGLSERIRVRSVVDRFLEHSRVFYFENGCQPEVYLSSADWMPRNFYKRIEIMWPIEDGNLRERIIQEILTLPLQDNVKASLLLPDGQYIRAPRAREATAHRSQMEFIQRAAEADRQAALPPRVKSKYPRVQVRWRPNEK
jgi:polyphosphate kinase